MVDRYDELYRSFRWDVPERFNIAQACCGRWAADRSALRAVLGGRVGRARPRTRSGTCSRQREPPVQRARRARRGARRPRRAHPAAAPRDRDRAHRGLPAGRDRAAAVDPVRPRRARVPAAAQRARASRSSSPTTHRRTSARSASRLPHLRARDRRRRRARSRASHDWDALLARRAAQLRRRSTRAADDPALLIYTSGTTGPPKGALMPHRVLIGNLPGFVHSHDWFPQRGRPVLVARRLGVDRRPDGRAAADAYFGLPIVGYRGRFDAETRARPDGEVRRPQHVPVPDRAQGDDEGGARSRASASTCNLRSDHERRRSGRRRRCSTGRATQLGVTINEMFGQTEINYIVGNCAVALAGEAGLDGPAVSRAPRRGDRRRRQRAARAASRATSRCTAATSTAARPGLLPRLLEEPAGDARQVHRRLVPHRRPGASATPTATSGTRAAPTTCSRAPATASARRRSRTASSSIRRSPTPRWSRKPDASAARSSRRSSCCRRARRLDERSMDELQQHVRGQLAPYEYPKEIEFIDALPMTTTGKVQRKELRKREEAKPKGVKRILLDRRGARAPRGAAQRSPNEPLVRRAHHAGRAASRRQIYSGMLPGVIAGHYRRDEARDRRRAPRRARLRRVRAGRGGALDPARKLATLADGRELRLRLGLAQRRLARRARRSRRRASRLPVKPFERVLSTAAPRPSAWRSPAAARPARRSRWRCATAAPQVTLYSEQPLQPPAAGASASRGAAPARCRFPARHGGDVDRARAGGDRRRRAPGVRPRAPRHRRGAAAVAARSRAGDATSAASLLVRRRRCRASRTRTCSRWATAPRLRDAAASEIGRLRGAPGRVARSPTCGNWPAASRSVPTCAEATRCCC